MLSRPLECKLWANLSEKKTDSVYPQTIYIYIYIYIYSNKIVRAKEVSVQIHWTD